MSSAIKGVRDGSEAKPAAEAGSVKKQEIDTLLRRADTARDDMLWTIAAEAYRAVLELEPERSSIWVQYGHMLKEAGKADEANEAYEQSLKLDPGNADTYLQIGHLFKIVDKKHQALQMYSRALELDPSLADAADELIKLGAKRRAENIVREAKKFQHDRATLYFDITDLLMYFRDNRAPTGIQRISLAVTDAALEKSDAAGVGLCAVDLASGTWKAIEKDAFQLAMLLSRESASSTDNEWKAALDRIFHTLATSPPLAFAPGSVILSLGSPWGVSNYFMAVREAKRLYGVSYVAFVHDTIPLLLPEFCEGTTANVYTRWIAGVSLHADLVLANAENTKRDFLKALARFSGPSVDCEVIYPNGDFSLLVQGAEQVSDEVRGILPTRYALFVGTIEPRKNHLLVLSAWRRLIAELGSGKMPALVLAGRMGWHNEQVAEFIRKTDYLDGKLKVLNEASDADLQALYKNAAFTVYNSHYEGWGLPVTESLSYGKVPLIPRNSSLVESGGKHAIFFDSNSEPSFLEAAKDLIGNPKALAKREELIRTSPPVRPWTDVFEQILAVVRKKTTKSKKDAAKAGEITLGNIYWLGTGRALRNPADFARGEAARAGNGWHPPEEWGVWSARRAFQMNLDVVHDKDARDGENLLLFVHFRGHREAARVRIEVNGLSAQACVVPEDRDAILRLGFVSSWSEHPQIALNADQSAITSLAKLTDGQDPRNIGVGVRSFMLCRESDILARVRFMEEVGFAYATATAGVTDLGYSDLSSLSATFPVAGMVNESPPAASDHSGES